MFCDLVGSTAMAERMDPEDLRDVIGAYHRCVAKTIARYRGFIAKYMGDGVLVYFGYPQAHEDGAELALRAGLKLVAKVAELRARPDLRLLGGRESLSRDARFSTCLSRRGVSCLLPAASRAY
jgi:class 3 adenylate cyclase